MTTRQTSNSKQTHREIARVFFSNGKLLILLMLTGAAVAATRSALQERTYRGRLELAAGNRNSESPRLPGVVELRRLVMSPETLDALAPSENRFRDTDPSRWLRFEPVIAESASVGSVWQVTVDIMAESRGQATERLLDYARRLQTAFDGQFDSEMTHAFQPHDASAFAFASYKKTSAPQAEPPSDDEQAEPAELPEDPYELQKTITQLTLDITDNKSKQRFLKARLSKLQAAASRFEDQPYPELPEELSDRSEYETLRSELRELEARRRELAARLKPAHPQYRALEQQTETVVESLKRRREQTLESLQAELDSATAQLASLSAENARLVERRLQLQMIEDSRTQPRNEQPSPEVTPEEPPLALPETEPVTEMKAPTQSTTVPEPAPTENAESDASVHSANAEPETIQPQRLRLEPRLRPAVPGVVVVAGPFVDPTAIQPRPIRDAVLGGVFGLLFGVIFVGVRARADQRIHSPYHLEQLELDIEIFGSIPKLKRSPVRVRRD